MSPYSAFVSGCEGPSIAVLCSVASRAARETQSSYLIETSPRLRRECSPQNALNSACTTSAGCATEHMFPFNGSNMGFITPHNDEGVAESRRTILVT